MPFPHTRHHTHSLHHTKIFVALALLFTITACGVSNPGSEEVLAYDTTLDGLKKDHQEQLNPEIAFKIENLHETYQPGQHGQVEITLTLDEESRTLRHAVAFLNIVKIDEENPDEVRQVAHELFTRSGTRESPRLFRSPWRGFQLIGEGRSTTLTFDLRDDAQPGQYYLALQVFKGNNVDPHRVKLSDRIGIEVHPFTIGNQE